MSCLEMRVRGVRGPHYVSVTERRKLATDTSSFDRSFSASKNNLNFFPFKATQIWATRLRRTYVPMGPQYEKNVNLDYRTRERTAVIGPCKKFWHLIVALL